MPHPNEITGWRTDPPRREFFHRTAPDGGPMIAAHINEEGEIHVWLDVATAKHAGSWVWVETKAEANALLARLYPVPAPEPEESPYTQVRVCERVARTHRAYMAAKAEHDAAVTAAREWFTENTDHGDDE